MNFPIANKIIDDELEKRHIPDIGKASIRELVDITNSLEKITESKFIRMEMGVPGLPSPEIAVNAEINALQKGVSAVYPSLDGIPELKNEISRLVKQFLDLKVSPEGCVPTVGSMQGAFASMLVANRCHENRSKGTIFIDPGFNIHKLQSDILGQEYASFDLYYHRGEKLREKLESYLETGQYQSILYSNPNNPTWQCLTEVELKIIGELASKYDVVVIEDLAYFGMDFRNDYSTPGKAPFQPSVGQYTEHYILLISSSKAFSYAGQRIGMLAMSDKLRERIYPNLEKTFRRKRFGNAMTGSVLYATSAGVSHSAQWALTALLKASNEGKYNFQNEVRSYEEKAKAIKKIFLDNGFHIAYDKDGEQNIADGFYFTIGYKGMNSSILLKKMLRCGICGLTLQKTGSENLEAIRICVSLISPTEYPTLNQRLQLLSKV